MRLKTIAIALASLSFVFARSPEERAVSDPQSIASVKNDRARPVPIDDLYFTRTITNGAWSPDGKEVVFTTNLTGRLNLWKVAAAGGWPVQLAVSDDRQMAGRWSPDGKWILWQQDRGGNEAWDLYVLPLSRGPPVNIHGAPDISESGALFSPDGKTLAFAYKPMATPVTEIAVMDVATRAVRKLTADKQADRTWSLAGWSPDGKYVYAN